MIVYEVIFSFECDSESGSDRIVVSNLRMANSEAKRILREAADERIAECERLNLELTRDKLTAEIVRVTVVHLDKEALCSIVNTQGGQWVAGSQTLGTWALEIGQRRIRYVSEK